MLFHCLQTEAGVFGDPFIAVSFARELRNLPFPLCEAGKSRQPEKLWPTKDSAAAAEIFARDQKMGSRDTGRFDLSELNCCSQIRRSRVPHLSWGSSPESFRGCKKTKPRRGNSPRLLFYFDYFFQPLPFPSGARAGAISGVRSTSSGVSSHSTSIKDFS